MMLAISKLIFIYSKNRMILAAIFIYLLIQIIKVLNDSWIDESWITGPGGVTEYKQNYVDLKSLAQIIYLAFPILVFLALKLKANDLASYGAIEASLGVAAGILLLSKLDFTRTSDWVSLATTTYFAVRGIENFQKGAATLEWKCRPWYFWPPSDIETPSSQCKGLKSKAHSAASRETVPAGAGDREDGGLVPGERDRDWDKLVWPDLPGPGVL